MIILHSMMFYIDWLQTLPGQEWKFGHSRRIETPTSSIQSRELWNKDDNRQNSVLQMKGNRSERRSSHLMEMPKCCVICVRHDLQVKLTFFRLDH